MRRSSLAAALLWLSVVTTPMLGHERPNFVVIMADDLGYGDTSLYGGWIDTPCLKDLATSGIRFTDFHSSGNVCSPTRAGLLTGRYQQRVGIPGVVVANRQRPAHQHGLPAAEVTFAELLQSAGYSTALYGKWHLGYYPQFNPIRHGFEDFRGFLSGNIDFFSHVDQAGHFDWWHQERKVQEEGYTTHLITRHACQFIRENRDRPFCLYLAHEAPHYPYQGPHDQAERSVGGEFVTQGARQDVRRAYREMVVELDRGIGEVMAELREHQLETKTLVWFFSDNGANRHGDNGPLRGRKGSNWEGGHRVPCVASWPQVVPAGGETNALSITLDVMPTLLAAAGMDIPPELHLDGHNLLPLLQGGVGVEPRQLFWNGKAMRDGPWKLVLQGRGGPEVGLYRVDHDLGESCNLVAAEAERVEQMQSALAAWRKDVQSGR